MLSDEKKVYQHALSKYNNITHPHPPNCMLDVIGEFFPSGVDLIVQDYTFVPVHLTFTCIKSNSISTLVKHMKSSDFKKQAPYATFDADYINSTLPNVIVKLYGIKYLDLQILFPQHLHLLTRVENIQDVQLGQRCFNGCSALYCIHPIQPWQLPYDCDLMWNGCHNTYFRSFVSGFEYPHIRTTRGMFQDCVLIVRCHMSMPGVVDASQMFKNCVAIESIFLGLNMLAEQDGIVSGCVSLQCTDFDISR